MCLKKRLDYVLKIFVSHSRLKNQHNLGRPVWPSYGSLSVDFDNLKQFEISSKLLGSILAS